MAICAISRKPLLHCRAALPTALQAAQRVCEELGGPDKHVCLCALAGEQVSRRLITAREEVRLLLGIQGAAHSEGPRWDGLQLRRVSRFAAHTILQARTPCCRVVSP